MAMASSRRRPVPAAGIAWPGALCPDLPRRAVDLVRDSGLRPHWLRQVPALQPARRPMMDAGQATRCRTPEIVPAACPMRRSITGYDGHSRIARQASHLAWRT